MSGRRATLARLLGELPEAAHAPTVALLGYARRSDSERDSAVVSALDSRPAVEERAPEAGDPGRLTTRFWRPETYELLAPLPEPEEEEAPDEGLTASDHGDPSRSLLRRPQTPSITRWPELEPRLRRALSASRRSREPDLPELVRVVGRGEVLERMPRRERQAWPSRLRVWMDRSERLLPLFDDQRALRLRLERACGPGVVHRHVLDPAAQAAALSHRGHFLGADAPRAGEAVLVLGDLGLYGGEPDRAAWLRTGRALAQRGVLAVALCPSDLQQIPPRLRGAWSVLSWGRGEPAVEGEDAEVERLLNLCASASLVQPGLLRALRLLLPEADLGVELRALQHPDIYSADASGVVLHADAAKRRLRAFLQEPSPVQASVAALIERWHVGLPAELLHAESLAWSLREHGAPAPGDPEAARAFFARLERSLRSEGRDGELSAWRRYTRAALVCVPEQALAQEGFGEVLCSLWARAHRGVDGVDVPEAVRTSLLRETQDQSERPLRRWALRQVGHQLVFQPAAERPDPALEEMQPGSPVAVLRSTGGLWVETAGGRRQHQLGAGLALPLPGSGSMTLATDLERLTLHKQRPHPDATRAGHDEYGLFEVIPIADVEHTFRWIPPGRFLMGSPEDEAGRWEDEGPQHVVLLTQGFWLGEAPVTQEQWRAVMGENPSRFQSPRRPVEQVSWEHAQRFCERANEHVLGLLARLPTEAEWERACRAGTGGPSWRAGAPLEQLAWFWGNSGGETHDVKGKPANPWGLYDMLGNVWEWCLGSQERYTQDMRTDPAPVQGSDRVVRGGSWDDFARSVRAATRVAGHPSERVHNLGFRLARGPQVQQPEAYAGGAQDTRGGEGAARAEPERATGRPEGEW